MESMEAIVPLAPEEPLFIVEECLDYLEGLDLSPIFVADVPARGVREAVEASGARLFLREDRRGRRAGAINDAVDLVESEHVLLMDVDSRVTGEFLDACREVVDGDDSVFLASGPRRVTNEDAGPVPLAVSAEYRLIGDLYRLISRGGGFLQFNGLIGVVRSSALREGLNEDVSCEDVEFATRAYSEGMRAVLVDAEVGEQAPPTLGELRSQRVRWLSGALETLDGHGASFLRSDAPLGVKATWAVEMLAPLLLLALSPLLVVSPAYGLRLWMTGEDRVLRKSLLIPLLGLLLAGLSAEAVARRLAGSRPEWRTPCRT